MEKLWTDNSALQTVTTFSKEKTPWPRKCLGVKLPIKTKEYEP